MAKRVAAVLPQTGAKPGEARPESHAAPKWNVHPTSTKVSRKSMAYAVVLHSIVTRFPVPRNLEANHIQKHKDDTRQTLLGQHKAVGGIPGCAICLTIMFLWGLQPLGGIGHAQEEAAWYVRSRCWQSMQCIRVLAALSVASQSEDRLGTAQLSEPNVGEKFSKLADLACFIACALLLWDRHTYLPACCNFLCVHCNLYWRPSYPAYEVCLIRRQLCVGVMLEHLHP